MQPTLDHPFFITTDHAAPARLLPGTVQRAEEALAESEAIMRGLALADPDAAAMVGRLQAAVSSLLWAVGAEAAA